MEFVPVTDDLTLTAGHFGKKLMVDKATAVDITIPVLALTAGDWLLVQWVGDGQPSFVSDGVTLNSSSGNLSVPYKNSVVYVEYQGDDTFTIQNGEPEDTWTTLAASVSGYTSFTTNDVTYIKRGKMVTIRGDVDGTGAATGGTITISNLPFPPKSHMEIPYTSLSGTTRAVGLLQISAGSSNATFYATIIAGNFAGSSVRRRINFTFTYEIA